jgi:hypothetical protein
MSEISVAAEAHPLEEDFDAYAEHVWRTRVAPALNELDELIREASLRSVFFGDVLGDLSSYARVPPKCRDVRFMSIGYRAG